MLKDNFTKLFNPFQKLVIDESLILFKGRVAFKQYIPSKRHRFGIKIFVLCDCETGMILDVIVYSASDIDVPKDDNLGFGGSVVKELLSKYLGQGHILYTDNYYTSPTLSSFLHENNRGSCGTVRVNMPKHNKLRKGEHELKRNGPIMALQWLDKRTVSMLSTVHKGEMMTTGKRCYRTDNEILKPDSVLDYTLNMRLVDKSDMMIGTIDCLRKSLKWYRKLFFHLLDVTLLNAYYLYLVKTGNKPSLRKFGYQVIFQLLEKYGKPTLPVVGRHVVNIPDRLIVKEFMIRHSLDNIPSTGGRSKGQRWCYVCQHTERGTQRRKMVTTWCKECGVGLCVGQCYQDYHTRKKF